MHIPDAILSTPVCAATAVISMSALGWAASRVAREDAGVAPGRFAGVTALIFAGQMLNVPLAFGSSGHLFGGVLAAALLGIPWGMLSIALVLLVQCLVFSDGGLAALGANVFNMALIGAGFGGWLAHVLRRKGLRFPLATGLAAVVAVLVAAVVASLQLAWSGAASLGAALGALFLPHVAVAGFEGLVTAAVVLAVVRDHDEVPTGQGFRPVWVFGFPLAALGLALLSPFASSLPDAYERGLEMLGSLSEDAPAFAGVLADYEMPGVGPALAVIVAGWTGTALVWVTARLLVGALMRTRSAG